MNPRGKLDSDLLTSAVRLSGCPRCLVRSVDCSCGLVTRGLTSATQDLRIEYRRSVRRRRLQPMHDGPIGGGHRRVQTRGRCRASRTCSWLVTTTTNREHQRDDSHDRDDPGSNRWRDPSWSAACCRKGCRGPTCRAELCALAEWRGTLGTVHREKASDAVGSTSGQDEHAIPITRCKANDGVAACSMTPLLALVPRAVRLFDRVLAFAPRVAQRPRAPRCLARNYPTAKRYRRFPR